MNVIPKKNGKLSVSITSNFQPIKTNSIGKSAVTITIKLLNQLFLNTKYILLNKDRIYFFILFNTVTSGIIGVDFLVTSCRISSVWRTVKQRYNPIPKITDSIFRYIFASRYETPPSSK